MKLKYMVFQYADRLVNWINYGHVHGAGYGTRKPNITVVSISDAGRFSEGYVLFYWENETPLLPNDEVRAFETGHPAV